MYCICLIFAGNQKLLECDPTWKELLKHYEAEGLVVDEEDI
jgi:hypothetical protein